MNAFGDGPPGGVFQIGGWNDRGLGPSGYAKEEPYYHGTRRPS